MRLAGLLRTAPCAAKRGVSTRGAGTGAACLGAALLFGLAVPVGAMAQPAPYLKGALNPEQSLTGISGLWRMQGHIPSSRPVRTRVARTEEGQLPPLLPEAAALLEKRLKAAENGQPFANMGSTCMPEGIPLMLFAAVEGPIEILETPGRVTIISQEFNEVWLIYLDQKHAVDPDPSWHGDSVAHWEGDTLVIDTIGLTDKTTIDHVGMPHSEDLRVVTRLRRLDKDTLEVRATMDDPKTFSRPWTRRFLYKRPMPGERVEEEVCDGQRNGVNSAGHATFLTYEDILAGKALENAK
jgi:hypothetical protein